MGSVESGPLKSVTHLLIVSAAIELGAGLSLLVAPAVVIRLLFGPAVEVFPAAGIARLTGVALLALGAACCWARNDAAWLRARSSARCSSTTPQLLRLYSLVRLARSVRCSGQQSSCTGQWGAGALGSLPLVDIYDSAGKQLVWRGAATKTLDDKANPQKRQENINKAVTKLLKNFPPPVKK